MAERLLTTAPHGHLLTNHAVWSADGRWIAFDTRTSPDGRTFDGARIERVDVATGRIEVLYEARNGACCGVVTCSPADDRVVFILGPERPTPDWSYGPARRQGVIVDPRRPGVAEPLDARDLLPPYTPGALRGGTHVHTFSGDGRLVASTYEDAVLDVSGRRPPRAVAGGSTGRRAESSERVAGGGLPRVAGAATPHAAPAPERTLRGIAVSAVGRPVVVPRGHPRNHDGSAFSVVVTRLSDAPRPGSDDISRACEEGWIGAAGYVRPDGTRRRHALAFQGTVVDAAGVEVVEAFVVDLPDDPADLARPGDAPLEGTPTTRPAPPADVRQRRLTRTADGPFPGLAGPRHWLRSRPDGSLVAYLARDDTGQPQLFAVNPCGGPPRQITRVAGGVASAFSFSPDGERIACVIDDRVCAVAVGDGTVTPLTDPVPGSPPRPEACVFSPDGMRIAFARVVPSARGAWTQVCVVDAPP